MKVYIIIEQYEIVSDDYCYRYIKNVFATRDEAEKFILSYDMNNDFMTKIWYEDKNRANSHEDIIRSFYRDGAYGEELTDFKIIEREVE